MLKKNCIINASLLFSVAPSKTTSFNFVYSCKYLQNYIKIKVLSHIYIYSQCSSKTPKKCICVYRVINKERITSKVEIFLS